jgi:DNA-binding LacI/PurR family transcriptional regulator
MTIPKSTVGLDEIAKKTKVAVSTVSRALRNLPGIHPETRSRILRAAQTLGYSARVNKSESTQQPKLPPLTWRG